MSYIIRERLEETTDRSTGKIQLIANIVADDAVSLPANTTDLEFVLGSEALCVDSGLKYRIDSSGNWIQQPGSAWTDVYSKSEVDALLAALPLLTRGDLYRGYQIVANTDVDSLTDYGTYYCDSSTTAATLSNCPISGSGFIMIVFSNGNRVRLFIAVSANYPRMLIQARTGGTWRTVREFAMLDQIPSASDINLLTSTTLERITLKESAGGTTEASTTRIGTQEYFEIPSGAHSFSFDAYYRSGGLQAFVCYYDSSKTYLGYTLWIGYAGWNSPGYPFPIPSGAAYFRVCFRFSDNSVITVSDMIKCILSFA